MNEKKYYDLFSLQAALKSEVEGCFPEKLWLKAEVSGISRKGGGHCYLELSQTERGSLLAKTRAVIWSSRYTAIDQYFRSVTGSSLDKGMEILCRVQVSYHILYGLTLTIDEVDPEFTLGEKQLRKQQTVERLQREGLVDLQKRLRLPALPYRLAVVTASGAAGWGDFRRHLLDNEHGFAFDLHLFEATMQGENAPESIISALEQATASTNSFDAVLILRGGGSELDLACFDDYDLAAAIARLPIPVFTAIGHDRDHHVADMVANTSVKTPTALADLFLDRYIDEDARLLSCLARLLASFSAKLHKMEATLDLVEALTRRRSELRVLEALHEVDSLQARVARKTEGRLVEQEIRIGRLSASMVSSSLRRLDRAEGSLDRAGRGIAAAASNKVAEALSSLMLTEARLKAADPRNILRKGFALALDGDGVKMRSASEGRVGERIQMMFADGTLRCGIVEVELKSNIPAEERSSELRNIG